MPIEFRCSQCNKLLRTPDETAGQQAKCPECGALMPVPNASPPPGPSPGASPFADDSPFASPQTGPGGSFHGTAAPPYADTGYAASQVSGPAIALIVIGSLSLLGGLLSLARLTVFGFGFPGNAAPAAMVGGVGLLITFASLALSVLIIIGGIKMKNLQNYGLAMAASIVAMTPCIGACCILGLPFGIWAVVVLSNESVRSAFRS